MTNQMLIAFLLASAASPAVPQGGTAAPKGPQPVSRAVYMSRIDGGFSSIDTNKDGFTDRAEIEAAESRLINNRRSQQLKQREAAFRQLDKDKNGSLSLQEFNAAIAAQGAKPSATPRLTRLDTNKDGKISMAENRTPAAARFDRIDTNKDGILSVEEQKKAPK